MQADNLQNRRGRADGGRTVRGVGSAGADSAASPLCSSLMDRRLEPCCLQDPQFTPPPHPNEEKASLSTEPNTFRTAPGGGGGSPTWGS